MRSRKAEVNTLTRQLRRKATNAEMKLWFSLRDRRLDGFKFTRQVPIGRYIADFVCRDEMIVVEVDGGQHADNAKDRIRDSFMKDEGYRVLRFWNNDVLANHDDVLAAILETLRNPN
jgi:very-short-patch-repair endonuclease